MAVRNARTLPRYGNLTAKLTEKIPLAH